MVKVALAGPGGLTVQGNFTSRLCFWLIVSFALEAAFVHSASYSNFDSNSIVSLKGTHKSDTDEQCLCGIAAYALFYSKVFGRHACNSISPYEFRSVRQSLGNNTSSQSVRSRRLPNPFPSAGNGSYSTHADGERVTYAVDDASESCVQLDAAAATSSTAGCGAASCPNVNVNAAGTAVRQAAAGGDAFDVSVKSYSPSCLNSGVVFAESREPSHSYDLVAAGAGQIADGLVRHRSSGGAAAAAADAGGFAAADLDDRLIVRFDRYAHADEHRALLRHMLGPEGPDSWAWLPRANAAARFPTDFGLLAPAPGRQGELRERLMSAAAPAGGGVRDVHAEKRYTGRLSWAPEGRLRDVVLDLSAGGGGAAAAEGGDGDGLEEAVFSVSSSRRLGRIVTRFSTEFLAGEDDPEALTEAEAASQRAWRAPAAVAAEDTGEAALDMGYGLRPEAVSAAGEEEEGEEEEHGGGLTGSRRRVASAAPRNAGAVLGSGRNRSGAGAGDRPQDDRSGGGDGERAHGHAHGIGSGGGHLLTDGEVGRHDGKHNPKQQQRLRQPLSRRRRYHQHAHVDPHSVGGDDAAAAGAAVRAAPVASTPPRATVARPSPPHTGRMGANLGLGDDDDGDGGGGEGDRERQRLQRRLHLSGGGGGGTVPGMLQADKLWKAGYTGKGVRVGIFDTGIRPHHPHIRNIRERTNWTHQDSLSDGLGHGSFVAGVVGGQDSQCPGFAPDVDLFTFKVFTDDQVSYTSWFLDAFNYAMIVQVNVINLSIGGPDYLDQPFVDKVLEVTSNGILLVSAIGNDGPLYGTLNNPADQNDVIGVGGIDAWDNIASFSSRGMSTWELPRGYGRVKPDVMAPSKDVQGSKIEGGCRSLSGTSVASPVVAGAVCLLASTVPEERRWSLLNPASMKQALVEGAVRLNNLNIYEQGSGRVNLPNSMAILQSYKPRASVIPAKLDLTDCPYMWPFCRQHLYAGALPVIFNATLLNGQGVVGWLEGPPVWNPTDTGGRLLHVVFEWSERLWPWSGFLALYIRVAAEGADFEGPANGVVECVVVSPPGPGEDTPRRSRVTLPLHARIAPPPPRSRRLLWDQFHSLKYPPAYLPRDNLDVKSDILDWHGDHPHTNFHGLFNALRDRGYFLEVLGSPATCFDPELYGALLVVDSEEEWYPEEVAALEAAVSKLGLHLLVFADWYNLASLDQMRFFDDNTRSWWNPATGGANVPALNDLLAPYGMALGDAVIHGTVNLAGMRLVINFGSDIAMVPADGWLHKAALSHAVRRGGSSSGQHAYLASVAHGSAGGHVVVFSDSNCLDRSHMSHNCYELVTRLLARLMGAEGEQRKQGLLDDSVKLAKPYVTTVYNFSLPARRPPSEFNFTEVSYVLSHPTPTCFPNGACEKQLNEPNCQAFLAANKAALTRKSAVGGSAAAEATMDSVLGAATAGAGGSRRGSGGGSGTVLLVHPDGTRPQGTALPLGLSGLQLLVLGGLVLGGLFLGVWVMRMGNANRAAAAAAAAAGQGSGGGVSAAGVGGGGPSLVGLTAARRDRLSNVRMRGSDV